jgi:hypothetical protein
MTGSVSLSALAVILAIGSFATAQPQPSNSAMPIEPISAIVQLPSVRCCYQALAQVCALFRPHSAEW